MTIQQCICQICTCGKHHCPQQPNVEENLVPTGCLLTEYQENFLAHCTTATCAATKPQNEWKPLEGKMENTTTFRRDYMPHKVTRRSTRAAKLYVPPDGTMMLTSTYSEDYKKHPVQQHMVNKQTREYSPPTTKMVATSLYKEEFKPWSLERCQPFRTNDNLTVNQDKFVTTTKGLPTEVPKPIKAKEAWGGNCAPFQATTEFRDQYKPWSLQLKQAHKVENYRPPVGSMDFLSTTHADYVLHEYQQVQHVRPPISAWEKDKEPFQGKSVMKEDYRAWDMVCQPHMKETVKSLGASENTSFRSQHRRKSNTFMHVPIQNAPSHRPMSKDSYIGKPLGLCPASFAEPPGFEYTCSKAGHRLYRTISVGDVSLAQEITGKSLPPSQRRKVCPGRAKDRRAH
ncbi:stabilizer of axonemal microtubules 2-like [Colossoma macropomum]|uniref:stabilizer of axonemal microtubules 2-like n=1 Tax=Colossoma macropomum TaxID=42526 RepID=UPI001864CD68|nr:stabilizer of axonemal microtubules 2-like [Colossoma macropomum]